MQIKKLIYFPHFWQILLHAKIQIHTVFKPKENTLNLLFEFKYQCVSKNVD